jgi:hypothetical protein
MVAVFDIAAQQGYGVARGIVKELAAVPNIPIGRGLASCAAARRAHQAEGVSPSRREARWKRAVEMKMGETKDHELPAEVAWSLLAQVLAESRLKSADSNLRRWLRLLQE